MDWGMTPDLSSLQNADGGWPYRVGGASRLEPTFYAMLAQWGTPAVERAWPLLKQWQMGDGGVSPGAGVRQSNWTTALWVTLHSRAGRTDGGYGQAVAWLVEMQGQEGTPLRRFVEWFKHSEDGYHPERYGWTWYPGTNSWIEPTVHAVIALKLAKAADAGVRNRMRERVELGMGMIRDRQCKDGGWNYGNRTALHVNLPSYPETTAVALLGLQGADAGLLKPALKKAEEMLSGVRSPLTRAWVKLALRVHGVDFNAGNELKESKDIMLFSLEMLGTSQGNYRLLCVNNGDQS
jgi:hypothetical protein